jgi:hypothetical protein
MTSTAQTFKIRHLGSDSRETIEAPSFLEAAQEYCKRNGFARPVDYVHSTDEIYTLLSHNRSGNVIGKFEIYEIFPRG